MIWGIWGTFPRDITATNANWRTFLIIVEDRYTLGLTQLSHSIFQFIMESTQRRNSKSLPGMVLLGLSIIYLQFLISSGELTNPFLITWHTNNSLIRFSIRPIEIHTMGQSRCAGGYSRWLWLCPDDVQKGQIAILWPTRRGRWEGEFPDRDPVYKKLKHFLQFLQLDDGQETQVRWNYNPKDKGGPLRWQNYFPQCGGTRQSPMELSNCQNATQMSRLRLTEMNTRPTEVNITNNGHSSENCGSDHQRNKF